MSNDQENKNKVLAAQLGKISIQFQKWQNELEDYKKWAHENDGAVSKEEEAEIDRRQKDIDAILGRVAQIVKDKGLMAFMGLPKVETKTETKEHVILPTEITLERPDPLKSLAALDNEDAMMMLEEATLEDVGPDDFLSVFGTWVSNMLTLLNEKAAYSGVKISVEKFNALKNQFNLASNLPAIAIIYSSLPENATVLGDVIIPLKKVLEQFDTPEKISAHYKNNKKKYSKFKNVPFAISPSVSDLKAVFDGAIDKNSVEYQKSVNKEKYVQEFLLWRSSLLSALKTWESFYANCTLGHNISKLPAEIGNSNNLSRGISVEIALLLSTSPIKYETLSKGITELLETKFTATWAAQQYEDYKAISLPNANRIIGFINSCILSSELQNCADNQGLANTIKTQEDYTQFMTAFKEYKESLRAVLLGIKINNPNSLPDTLIIDLKLFYENYASATIGAIKTGAPTIEAIARMMKEKLNGNYSTIDKTKEALIAWIDMEHENATWLPEQYFLWKRNTMPFPSANAIAAAVHDAYVAVNADSLRNALVVWRGKVQSAFSKDNNRCLVKNLFEKQLAALFQIGDALGQDTMFVYKMITEKINAGPLNSKAEFTQKEFEDCVWKGALTQLTDTAYVGVLFEQLITKYGPYAVKNFVEDTVFSLPDITGIEQALRMSTCYQKTLILPQITHSTFNPQIDIEGLGTLDLIYRGNLLIKLDYLQAKMMVKAKMEDKLFPIPKNVQWIETYAKDGTSTLVDFDIKKSILTENNLTCSSTIELKFRVVKDIKTLFGLLNLDETKVYNDDQSKSFNWGELLSRLAPYGVPLDAFLNKTGLTMYVTVFLTIKSEAKEGNLVMVSSEIVSESIDWKALFEDNSKYLGPTNFYPELKYK
jgi:hypothetical protein